MTRRMFLLQGIFFLSKITYMTLVWHYMARYSNKFLNKLIVNRIWHNCNYLATQAPRDWTPITGYLIYSNNNNTTRNKLQRWEKISGRGGEVGGGKRNMFVHVLKPVSSFIAKILCSRFAFFFGGGGGFGLFREVCHLWVPQIQIWK